MKTSSRFDENAPTAHTLHIDAKAPTPKGFRSLRWRVLTPLTLSLLVALLLAAYVLGYIFLGGIAQNERDSLISAGGGVAQNAAQAGRDQRAEVDRIAFTQGLRERLRVGDGAGLRPLIEPLAALASLDLVVVGDVNGQELIGLQRVVSGGGINYAVTTQTSLSEINAVARIFEGADSASSIISVERRPMLVTAGPVSQDGELRGVVLVGSDLRRLLNELQRGTDAELALFGGEGVFLDTTISGLSNISLAPELYTSVYSDLENITFESVRLDGTRYEAAYFPFVVGQTPLGVVAAYRPQNYGAVGGLGRVALSGGFALIVALVGVVGYLAMVRPLRRLRKVTQTAEALAAGESVKTNLKPTDEIGVLGVALDRYAAAAQVQVRQIQIELQGERRQVTHLHAILESLPDGLIVQDSDGRVMTMNAAARALLGTKTDSAGAEALRMWSATAQHRLGALLAPGVYALEGGGELIKLEGRLLRVEAAALQSGGIGGDKLMGRLLTLRDATSEMMNEAQRQDLLDHLAQDVGGSLSEHAQAAALEAVTRPNAPFSDTLGQFAKAIAQDAQAMQHMIAEYHDLTLLKPHVLQRNLAPLPALDLLIDLIEEWRPSALAAGLALDFSPHNEDDLHILGDAKRLLWALGNILDNAIKYSDGAGQIILSASADPEQGRLNLSIQDQGVGIAPEELPQVFTRFYRGQPRRANGEPLTVVGAGQGLYMAYKVIESHGGTLGLSSRLGQGTTALISLPLTADVALEMPSDTGALAVNLDEVQVMPSAGFASIWDSPTGVMILRPEGESGKKGL